MAIAGARARNAEERWPEVFAGEGEMGLLLLTAVGRMSKVVFCCLHENSQKHNTAFLYYPPEFPTPSLPPFLATQSAISLSIRPGTTEIDRIIDNTP